MVTAVGDTCMPTAVGRNCSHAVSRHYGNGESGLELYKSAVPQIDKLAWKHWLDKVQMQGEGIDI